MFDDVPDPGSRQIAAASTLMRRASAGRLLRRMASGSAWPAANAGAGEPAEARALDILRATGLLALACLPVLLAVSLALGKVLAVPAALFVPLLVIGRIAGARPAPIAAAAVVLPVGIGLLLVAGSGLDDIQPVAVNCGLLAAFACVPLGLRLSAGAGARDPAGAHAERRRLGEAIASVDACAPDCAAIGLDRDLVCVAATRAAFAALELTPFELIGGDFVSRAELFGRPALLNALLRARDTGEEAPMSFCMALAGDAGQGLEFAASARRLPGGAVVLVIEPARGRRPFDANLVDHRFPAIAGGDDEGKMRGDERVGQRRDGFDDAGPPADRLAA